VKFRRALFAVAAAFSLCHVPRARGDVLSDAEAAYIQQGFGMFIHFNMPTFVGDTNTPNQPNVNVFNPYLLNTDQWAATAAAAGMKYIVFTAKHEDGFALWNTPESSYNITNTTWAKEQAPGQADIIARLQASCDKYGIKLDLYFSNPDLSNGVYRPGTQGTNAMTDTLYNLPDPHANDFNIAYETAQIKELVALDPKVGAIWTDNYGRAYTDINQFPALDDAVKTGNPGRIFIVNGAPFPMSDIQTFERQTVPAGTSVPAETCDTLSQGWFVGAGDDPPRFTPQQVADTVNLLESRGANYLLDVQVDRTGMIGQAQVNTLVQTGQLLGVNNAPAIPNRPVRPAANLPNAVSNGTFDPSANGAGNGTIGGGWTQHGNVTLTNSATDTVMFDTTNSGPEDFVIFKPDTTANGRAAGGEISQTVATVPGQQYYVFFRLGVEATNTGNAGVRVSATGAPSYDFWSQNDVFKFSPTYAGNRWVNWAPWDQAYTFTATSDETTLDFLDITDYNAPTSGWDYMSDVTGMTLDSVAIAPVPEPTCLALAALCSLPILRRRGRST
jgi:alpha-L-fucosidase